LPQLRTLDLAAKEGGREKSKKGSLNNYVDQVQRANPKPRVHITSRNLIFFIIFYRTSKNVGDLKYRLILYIPALIGTCKICITYRVMSVSSALYRGSAAVQKTPLPAESIAY